MKHRTFIAIPASPEVRHGASRAINRLRPSAGNVRWTAPDNLHWTLQFLGDVDDLEIPDVCGAVAAASADFEPFELVARGVGAFPAGDRPRTLWIGAGQGADALVALQAAIERRLIAQGYRAENRRYVPHLTLGRAGRGAHPTALAAELAALADFDAGATLVDEVSIYASELTRDGAKYRELGHAPLGQE